MDQEEQGFDVADLETDPILETGGVWKDLPKGARVKIARWGNPEFARLLRSKLKANRVLIDGDDDLSEKVSEQIITEVMARTILKDVSGIRFRGKVVDSYNPKVGEQLLSIGDFRARIKAFSEQEESYRVKAEEASLD